MTQQLPTDPDAKGEVLRAARFAPLLRTTKSDQGTQLVDRLAEELIDYELAHGLRERRPRPDDLATLQRTIGAFVADLVLHSENEEGMGFLYRSDNKDDFAETVATYRQFRRVRTAFHVMGYLEIIRGIRVMDDFDGAEYELHRYATRYRGTLALLDFATDHGIGPITASALVSALPDISDFKSGRDLSAWLGLTPLASCDEQVTRRYYKYQLEPISAVSDAKLLRLIIRTLCAEVGISAPAEGDLLSRLVHASRKRFGRYIAGPDANHEIRWFSSDDVYMFKAKFTTPALLADEHGMLLSDVYPGCSVLPSHLFERCMAAQFGRRSFEVAAHDSGPESRQIQVECPVLLAVRRTLTVFGAEISLTEGKCRDTSGTRKALKTRQKQKTLKKDAVY